MRLKELTFTKEFKQFKENSSFSFSSNEEDLNISVLVGRNGSGKTTMMSVIATLFHNIERYIDKIPASFNLTYTKNIDGQLKEISISHSENLIRVNIEGIYENVLLVPKRNAHKLDYRFIDKNKPHITIEDFLQFLPEAIVTSIFSFHGEYPISRPPNYGGYQLVTIQSITDIYGKNHWSIGSISLGIFRFLKIYFHENNKLRDLLKLFDLEFNNKILFSQTEWEYFDSKLLQVSDEKFTSEYDYLNDLEFVRKGRIISLGNMSSGEKMLLLRTITILNSIRQNSIVIIEEPELHLDPVWSRQLTTLFNTILSEYNTHIIIATHNYSIINSVKQSNLVHLERGSESEIPENTFLASYDELFRVLYGDDFKSNIVENDFLNGISKKSLEELENDFNLLGNSIYKYLVFKEIKNRS